MGWLVALKILTKFVRLGESGKMRRNILIGVIFTVLITEAFAQYGIPDDDDEVPRARSMPAGNHRMRKSVSLVEEEDTFGPSIFQISSRSDPLKNMEKVKMFASSPVFTSQGTFEIKKAIPIVKFKFMDDHLGRYNFETISGDGTSQKREGSLKKLKEGTGSVMQGSYEYVGDDGKTYSVSWKADEDGFQASGAHLLTK